VSSRRPLAVLCLALGLLAWGLGCVAPAPQPTVITRTEDAEGERFFRYFAYVRSLAPEALQREYTQQEAAFAQSRSPEDRLRLALVLSMPDTPFGNRLYALELLHAALNEPEQPHTRFLDIAALLVTFIQSPKQDNAYELLARRLQSELRDQARQLTSQQQLQKKLQEELDARRAAVHQLTRQLQDALGEQTRHLSTQQQLQKKLQEERKNVKKLQEKIEKIKDIERSLIERDQRDNKGT